MPRRILFLLFLLLLAHPASLRAADEVSVTVRQFALGGAYSFGSDPVWLQVSVKNASARPQSFQLQIQQLNLPADASPMADTINSPQTLQPGETRTLDFPINLAQGDSHHSVIYVQAIANDGTILGRTARTFGDPTMGRVIVLLCGTPSVCSSIQQAILLTGSPAEQTRKSREFRLIQLTDPPPVGWAYQRASTVVLAAPASRLAAAQRDALELFMLRGGRLVIIEDLLDEPAGSPSFLSVYRRHFPADRRAPVSHGNFLRIRSTSIPKLADALAPDQDSGNSEADALRERMGQSRVRYQASEMPRWFMMRAGTSFRFPSFFTLLFCTLAYIAITGIINFVVLRRLGRPELGWISIPGFALLFSLLLYFIAIRTHPSNYGLDQMTIYQMTDLSPLATSSALVRVSSPSRSELRLSVPATVTQSGPGFASDFSPPLRFSPNRFAHSEIELSDKYRIPFPLRRWAFRDFDFKDQHRFAGTIYRDSVGRLHNETGVNFRQAIVADQNDIFVLSSFPDGAVVDLAQVQHVPYESATARFGQPYPAPPFPFDQLHYSPPAPSAEEVARFTREYAALSGQPLSALELVRGWPSVGKFTFSESKAVFLGLADSPSLAATLPGRTPAEKSASLVVVTFEVWP
jgi:hypothetical protein